MGAISTIAFILGISSALLPKVIHYYLRIANLSMLLALALSKIKNLILIIILLCLI